MPHRSVYLHNNELTDTGLPDHMFNGSDNLEILTMSSNFLRVVPRYLPSTLYRLHMKVGFYFAINLAFPWCIYNLITSGLFPQSNKLEEIPVGAFNNLPNLRELYLQNNLLSNEGMDNETFRWRKFINYEK